MTVKEENGKVILGLEGRIDSNNAGEVEKQVMEALAAHAGMMPVINMGKLAYISSAGLRVLMKIRKRAKVPVDVLDCSPEVYDILDTTGFTELLNVRKKLREVSVEGCPEIGSGGYSVVYRLDPETIIKVYKPQLSQEFVEKERDLSQKAFVHGVPTAISYDVVSCGDSYGVVYELLNASTVAEIADKNPERVPELGFRSGKLLKELHSIEMEEGLFPDKKQTMLNLVDSIRPYLEEEEYQSMRGFVNSIPERRAFLHGDFHMKNVMLQDDEFVLIDIGDASFGHPIFDLAETMVAYVFLPRSNNRSDEEKHVLLGFDPMNAGKMWGSIVSAYFDVKDPEEIGKITQKLMPYAYLQICYQGFTLAGGGEEAQKARVDGLVRKMFLPSIKGAGELFF